MASDGVYEKPKLKGDWLNIFLLISMYILQCLPRSLANSIQLILQKRHVTYEEQAVFSLVPTLYTIKLLWAPIIDCKYFKKIGRRKSWVIPLQYLISALLLLASMKVDDWTGSEDGTRRPNIHLLTVTFMLISWFSSMQDVAVDGWALTMLSKRNVGQQGTCNNLGFAVGQVLGYIVFTLLSAKEFCNYFRPAPLDHGFITFADFMFFWAVVFIIATTLIFIFKRDNSLDHIEDDGECKLRVIDSYKRLWKIFRTRPIQKLCFMMLSVFIFFGPVNGVASLKLMDAGVPRDKFVLVSLPTLLALLVLPFSLDRYLTKKRALGAFLASFLIRLIFNIVYAVFIYFTPLFKNENGDFSAGYYGLLLVLYNIDHVADYAIWITGSAFGCHITDNRFGAMYATLFNSSMQIGNKWGNTLFIGLKDHLTITSCSEAPNAKCTVIVDGFYVEIVICLVTGFIWLYWARKQVNQLEKMDASAFRSSDEPTTVFKDKLLQIGDTGPTGCS